MSKKSKSSDVYIWDMLHEIECIERALERTSLYDRVISRAVLGTAAKRVDDITRAKASAVPWQKMVDTRNFISHEYEEINLEKIKKISENHLTDLKMNLLALYKELTGTNYAH